MSKPWAPRFGTSSVSTTCAFLVTFLLATTMSGARAEAAPCACVRSGAGSAARELRAWCIASS